MPLSRSSSTSHTQNFVRTNDHGAKARRRLSAKERLVGAVETVEFSHLNYNKHQTMKHRQYSGSLTSDEGEGNVSFRRMPSGELLTIDEPKLPSLTNAMGGPPRPEDIDDFSYDGMSISKKVSILQERHKLAEIRDKAKKAGFRNMTLKMKQLREQERRYFTDAKKSKKKKKKKCKKLKEVVNKATGKAEESFAQIAIDSLLFEVNNAGGGAVGDDDMSLGETSLGDHSMGDDSVGGSSMSPSVGEYSLASQVSQVSMMPLDMRMSTNVTIARAMERFNKRKEVFERKKAKTETARAKLLSKVHEKKMKPIRLRRQRRKEKAKETWMKTIIFMNAAKLLKDKFEERKALLAKMAEQNDAAVKLQRTLSTARTKKMWAKYIKFHDQVFKSKWVFQMAIRTWRKKVRMGRWKGKSAVCPNDATQLTVAMRPS